MTDNLDFFNIDLDSDNSDITANSSKTSETEPKAAAFNESTEENGREDIGEPAENDFDEDEEEEDEAPPASDEHRKKKRKNSVLKEIISYMLVIAAAFVLAFFTNHFLIVNARIPTGSMIPTIMEGDRIIGNRLAYNHSEPKRGDVIVFYNPDNEEEKYVKRVIGLPGETVRIVDGAVYIDGQLLDESAYLDTTPYGSYGPYTVPEDCYFMMGDNRNSSWDSRFWSNTYVHKNKIIAKAVFCYYPDIHLVK